MADGPLAVGEVAIGGDARRLSLPVVLFFDCRTYALRGGGVLRISAELSQMLFLLRGRGRGAADCEAAFLTT